MTTIGVSGHQKLPKAARVHAEREIRRLLSKQSESVIGLGSLAEGADQLFAEILLSVGGTLRAVIPSRGYQDTFESEDRARYYTLLAAAESVTVLDFDKPGEEAYYAAGKFIVENCDILVAIWDGEPARGLGGTGDAVAHALKLGREVMIFWPQGLQRA